VNDDQAIADDRIGVFQIEGWPVRGRIVRLGDAIETVLSAHHYPEPVANLLGELCALAALVGSSLKFEGRLIIQVQGNGPVRFAVCDYETVGEFRGYCRFDPDAVEAVSQDFAAPGAKTLLGDGLFIMTLDQGPDMDRYQGVTPIEGETLAHAAEQYFAQSEQTPTKIRLAVGQVTTDQGTRWRAGGMLIQNIASDDARGSTEEAWDRTRAFFLSLGEDELLDPDLSSETLLWRLFHEDGVRVFDHQLLRAVCKCSQERIASVIASFSAEERSDMIEADGMVRVTCEYCSTTYELPPH
jgi:molecular chaperone Hsp33